MPGAGGKLRHYLAHVVQRDDRVRDPPGSGFWVPVSEFGVRPSGFRDSGSAFGFRVSGFRVPGPGFWASGAPESLGLTDYSQVYALGLRHKSVNFGAEEGLGSKEWWAKLYCDRGGVRRRGPPEGFFDRGCRAGPVRAELAPERREPLVWGLGFGVWGLGFGVWGVGFGGWGLGVEGWG